MKKCFKAKLDVQATFNYSMLKTYQKEILQRQRNYAKKKCNRGIKTTTIYLKVRQNFVNFWLIKFPSENSLRQRRCLPHQSNSKGSTWKWCRISAHWNYHPKVKMMLSLMIYPLQCIDIMMVSSRRHFHVFRSCFKLFLKFVS